MGHAIEQFTDGTAAFFSNREVPWHRLGELTDGAQSVKDALRLAQLDWEVVKSTECVQVPVLTADGVVLVQVEGKYATYRDHKKLGLQGLGVVGEQYTPVQNEEAFDFLNVLSHESGAVFETAGSLFGGKRVFMSMKMPEALTLADGQDTVDLYLMATNAHDGTRAFTVSVTPVRPVCANTVAMALAAAKSTWTVRHTSGVKGKVQAARESLGLVVKYEDAFAEAVQGLAMRKMTERDMQRFVEALVTMPKKDDVTDRVKQRVLDTRAEITALWHAPTQQMVAGTAWAAYNAVTEWADWASPVRAGKGKDAADVRAFRTFKGAHNIMKQRAYALLSK